jgi:predicted ArsR family transcriptional regulator
MMSDWTFFSNYGHVLVCLARNNQVRLRDVALEVGITERAVQKIVKDMQEAGFLTVSKQGRRNRYRINRRKSLRHGLESHCNVGKLLALVTKPDRESRPVDSSFDESIRKAKPQVTTTLPDEIVTRYPSVAEKRSAEPDSKKNTDKAKPADTRQQGSLF